MSAGARIRIDAIGITYSGATPAALEDWASFRGVLLSVCLKGKDSVRLAGSAVLVAPGVALYARHVLDERLAVIREGNEAIYCFGITPRGLRIWIGRELAHVYKSDLGIMGLQLASDFQGDDILHISQLTTRLPKVGEQLLICGFRASETEFPPDAEDFSGRMIVSTGVVTERYPRGRDRVILPSPCLEVACRTWGGMSGGPAFDSHGRLVGILSTSVGDTAGGDPSFVSLVWPALTTRFKGGWPAQVFGAESRLLELDPQLCDIDDRGALLMRVDAATGLEWTRYQPWETSKTEA